MRFEDPGARPRLTDEELLGAIARFDVLSFELLYERHAPAAFALARHMLGSHAAAEDAVQEAFLNLWRSAARYDRERGPVRPWLLGIVRHRSIDILRRLNVQERRGIALGGLEDRIASGEDIGSDVIGREEAMMVRSSLAALPPEQRQVLELAYYGGWTHTEIAEHFDMPLGTVKSRTRHGLEKLRWALGEIARPMG